MSEIKYKSEVESIDAFVGRYKDLTTEIGKVIVGQDDVIKNVLEKREIKKYLKSQEKRIFKYNLILSFLY